MEEIARRNPNAEVFRASHTHVQKPWKVKTVRKVVNKIHELMTTEYRGLDLFTARKRCCEDELINDFHKRHLELFFAVSDREKMEDVNYRSTIFNLIELRSKIERGEVEDGLQADAMATSIVMNTLSSEKK